ncbi:MAG TPA: hypothetical protein H9902_12380 [Candidatus Stackebrandtia faecavium]|nr:hypothetical protein [Candidatus Stackebrandtia faecavium]
MKTKRRALATAAIGVMAAGLIGFGSHTAFAETTNTSDNVSVSAGCSWYKNKADNYEARAEQLRAQGDWTGARWASKKAEQYLEKYYACTFG